MDNSINVDPFAAGSTIALVVGLLLVAGGIYLRRHGRMRGREGAALLAGIAALIGVAVFGWGAYALIQGDGPRPVDVGAVQAQGNSDAP